MGYIVGMLVYVLNNHLLKLRISVTIRKANIWRALFAAGILLLVFRIELIKTNTIYQILLYYVTVFVTMVSAMQMPLSNKNALVKIGDHSFGIYLLHFTVGGIITTALKDYLPVLVNGGIAICCSVLVGYAFDSFGNEFGKMVGSECKTLESKLAINIGLKRKGRKG